MKFRNDYFKNGCKRSVTSYEDGLLDGTGFVQSRTSCRS